MTDTNTRDRDLRLILTTRQREMQDDLQKRMRHGRTRSANEVSDVIEHSDADLQDGVDLALLQMRTETLIRIDDALLRLDAGEFGVCSECGGEIAERRLRALPFALRCQTCEETREREQGHARWAAQRRTGFSLFPDAAAL